MGIELSAISTIITALISAVDGLQRNGVQAERIALLKDQLEVIAQRVVALEKENADLITENAKLNEELACYHVSEEFIQHQGALFRREISGLYGGDPICPGCHGSMVALGSGRMPFRCGDPKCGRTASFSKGQLAGIVTQLNKRKTEGN